MAPRFVCSPLLLATCASAIALAAPTAAVGANVTPTVDCVTTATSATSLWVYFGYVNTGSQTSIDFGDANQVVPGLGFQGQPTIFNPGAYPRVFRALFNTAAFSGISWELDGRTATATTSTPRCVAATTGPASAISTTGATVSGIVEADSIPVAYTFEYGKVGGPSLFTLERQAPPGASLTATEALTGLEPGTTYRYKLIASGSITTIGQEQTFTTQPLPVAPPAAARLAVQQTATPASVRPGELVTATVTLANTGPDTAQETTVRLSLPTGASVDAASLPPGCSPADDVTVTCSIGTIAAGGSAIRAVAFRPAQVGTARIVASASATTPDPDLADNVALSDVVVTIPPGVPQPGVGAPAPSTPLPPVLADLALQRGGPTRRVRLGRTTTIKYSVANRGTASAPGTVLVLRLPSGIARRSVTGAPCTGRRVLRCRLGELAVGAERSIVIGARVRSLGSHRDSASVTAVTGESVVTNNLAEGLIRTRR